MKVSVIVGEMEEYSDELERDVITFLNVFVEANSRDIIERICFHPDFAIKILGSEMAVDYITSRDTAITYLRKAADHVSQCDEPTQTTNNLMRDSNDT